MATLLEPPSKWMGAGGVVGVPPVGPSFSAGLPPFGVVRGRGVWAAGLPYERVDYLGRILARGRIGSMSEYEVAVDSVVAGEQDGRLTPEQATTLAELIGRYERRRNR